MKFTDIKAGDTVYVKAIVNYGFSGGKGFWVPKIVDRVTPKQFLIGEVRYSKEDGRRIGGRWAS